MIWAALSLSILATKDRDSRARAKGLPRCTDGGEMIGQDAKDYQDGKPFCRLKGGVQFDPKVNAFRAFIHFWANGDGVGQPKEWQSSETFPTEEDALVFYKAKVQPRLESLAAAVAQKTNSTFRHQWVATPSDRQGTVKKSPK